MPTYDISFPIRDRMAGFPGDPVVRVQARSSVARGDPYSVSFLSLSSHTGTHVDPPSHFLRGGRTVDTIDPSRWNGRCRVLEVDPAVRDIGARDVSAAGRSERLLLRSSNSARWHGSDEFFADYAALTLEGAERLLEFGVRLVGIDALSIERDSSGEYPVHHRLLGADCLILEGLRLEGVPAGDYTLQCLPLRIEGGDGAPARALLHTA